MKKKIGFGILLLVELLFIVGVYFIRGQIGAYLWSANVFIIAPIAAVAFLAQLIVLIIRIVKKKKIRWNAAYIILSFIMTYPITILMGISVLTYPTSNSEKDTISVSNPVQESVLLGGKEYKTHAVWPSECYAYDILKEPYDIDSDDLYDYGIYLADVYCPVNGTVIDCKDTEEDILPNTEEFESSLGNYIFIEVDETGTYLILSHLEKDSVLVDVGEHVTKGMKIAKVGNSGTTSEPHLHMQHQRNNPLEMKIPVCAEGLPMKIEN
ncbi:M23 family metallopeptidase [Roseburia sp. 499]|uniref:M23 family metallopeptidase n=1 Tax=Roseburia sp. 499 TaxID=1261634 RepID=UPI000950B795|nr:M23 family metallopeptidase [Roseburia sp. 499]WVK70999.1 M23 family metallopeptidase [Roseburia sp. 499]